MRIRLQRGQTASGPWLRVPAEPQAGGRGRLALIRAFVAWGWEAWIPGKCFLLRALFILRGKTYAFLGAEKPREGTIIYSLYDQDREDGDLTALPPNSRTGRPGAMCFPSQVCRLGEGAGFIKWGSGRCCELPTLLLRHLFYLGACYFTLLQVRALPPIGSLLSFHA